MVKGKVKNSITEDGVDQMLQILQHLVGFDLPERNHKDALNPPKQGELYD